MPCHQYSSANDVPTSFEHLQFMRICTSRPCHSVWYQVSSLTAIGCCCTVQERPGAGRFLVAKDAIPAGSTALFDLPFEIALHKRHRQEVMVILLPTADDRCAAKSLLGSAGHAHAAASAGPILMSPHAVVQPVHGAAAAGGAALRPLPDRRLLHLRLPRGERAPAGRLRVRGALDGAAAAGRGPRQPRSQAHAAAGGPGPTAARM